MPRHRALTLISPFLNLQLSLVLLRRGDKMTLQDKAFLSSLSCFKEEDISLLYMISNHIYDNYRIIKLKKRNGKERVITAPKYHLKRVQRILLEHVLMGQSISSYAMAYRKGYSLKDNAKVHVGKHILLKLDIKDFFDNISFMDVYRTCFSEFPKSIGMLFTYLVCYDEHLPQGAVTSPMISNLILKDFDEEVGHFCELKNISYTRYSDDLTFSGDFKVREVISFVSKLLKKQGLELNYHKIHVVRHHQRQLVTGVLVNNKVSIPDFYKKNIRQEMYYIRKYGVTSHLEYLHQDMNEHVYLNSLLGKVNYVLQVEPSLKEFLDYRDYLRKIQ